MTGGNISSWKNDSRIVENLAAFVKFRSRGLVFYALLVEYWPRKITFIDYLDKLLK